MVVRAFLVVVGLGSVAWSFWVIPALRSEATVVDVANSVLAGEIFKPEILSAIDAQSEVEGGSPIRPSVLSRSAIIRLRLAEIALVGNDAALKEKRLQALVRIVDRALSNVPGDAFLWLARSWLDSIHKGPDADSTVSLRRSYDLGPNEGWIAVKRDGVALAAHPALPSDLAERSISEFVSLVRWGFITEATEIAAATPVPLRRELFSRLKAVDDEQRGAFARSFYTRELDEVPVPGFPPPPPPIQPPLLPPDL